MSHLVAESVRGRCGVIAVSNAYLLAPWADALCSCDVKWWNNHPDAFHFKGRKFCSMHYKGLEPMPWAPPFTKETNSGLRAMAVARDVFGATKILMLGFDMHGTHFFGRHRPPLQNPNEARFGGFRRQFNSWRGPEAVNCTPGSSLTRFRFSTIDEELPMLEGAVA